MQRATLILYYGWDFNCTQVRKFWVNVPLASPIQPLGTDVLWYEEDFNMFSHAVHTGKPLQHRGGRHRNNRELILHRVYTAAHDCLSRLFLLTGNSGKPLTAAVAPLTSNGSFTGRFSKGLLLLLGIREKQPCLKCSEPETVRNFFKKGLITISVFQSTCLMFKKD